MILRLTPNFYSGTSNIVLPVPNKSYYPPEYQQSSRLHYYASLFNSIEINSSFYKIPLSRTLEKWYADVPEGFRFSFKLWRGITHAKELNYEAADINKFIMSINAIGDKKGGLLIQFPASIKASYFLKFKRLLADVYAKTSDSGWQIAVEFRDRSWYRDVVYELLDQYGMAVVIHDIPASATPLIDMDARFVYMRFHGEKGDYRGSYPNDFLEEHAAYMKAWLEEGKTVYVYFNNSLGDAVGNLITLNDY
jgi:uncharacterized protein YecE (DUF72 family)